MSNSFNLKLKFDSHHADWWLNDLQRRQLPYATSRALNDVALLAQISVRASLPNKFTVRGKWVPKGIQVILSNKSQWPDMKAYIGSRDSFMALQEDGGTKKGSKSQAIPTGIRTPSTKITSPKLWPKALLETSTQAKGQLRRRKKGSSKRTAFVTTLKNGKHAIAVRTSANRYPIKILYVFEKEVRIKKRFGLFETVQRSANRNMQPRFIYWFAQAIRTAR
jgi:hypothetical protein